MYFGLLYTSQELLGGLKNLRKISGEICGPLRSSRNICPGAKRLARILLPVFALALAGGCAASGRVSAPRCPPPSVEAVDQLLFLSVGRGGEYDELMDWVSRIDRYCGAVDAAR